MTWIKWAAAYLVAGTLLTGMLVGTDQPDVTRDGWFAALVTLLWPFFIVLAIGMLWGEKLKAIATKVQSKDGGI